MLKAPSSRKLALFLTLLSSLCSFKTGATPLPLHFTPLHQDYFRLVSSSSSPSSSDSEGSGSHGSTGSNSPTGSEGGSSPPSSSDYSSDSDFSQPDLQHFSQSGHPEGKAGRTDFNHETITKHIDHLQPFIENFMNHQSFPKLHHLLTEIAKAANIAYNEEKKGTTLGVHKHTLCKDFLETIKTKYPAAFADVHPEYPLENSRLDVVWFHNHDAYVFDYKFGEGDNVSTPRRADKYKEALKGVGFTMKGGITDINPSR